VRRRSQDVRLLVVPVAVVYLVISLFLNGLEFVAVTYPCAILLFLGSGRSPDEQRFQPGARGADDVGDLRPALPIPVA
jgi:hypothetical protein